MKPQFVAIRVTLPSKDPCWKGGSPRPAVETVMQAAKVDTLAPAFLTQAKLEAPDMKLRTAAMIWAVAAMPAMAQPQPGGRPPNAPKPTMAQVQKVVAMIRGDKTKTQQYCDLGHLNEQMAEAEQKNDMKRLDTLGRQADELAQKIGPEYVALMDGLGLVDEDSTEGKQFIAALDKLDELCAKR